MAEKLMTVNLGGKERVLDFSRFHFTKFYQKETKNRPDITNAEMLELYILCALKADYKHRKEAEDFTPEDVENWLGDMLNNDLAEVEKQIVAIIKGEQPGEEKTQTAGV